MFYNTNFKVSDYAESKETLLSFFKKFQLNGQDRYKLPITVKIHDLSKAVLGKDGKPVQSNSGKYLVDYGYIMISVDKGEDLPKDENGKNLYLFDSLTRWEDKLPPIEQAKQVAQSVSESIDYPDEDINTEDIPF